MHSLIWTDSQGNKTKGGKQRGSGKANEPTKFNQELLTIYSPTRNKLQTWWIG